MLKSPKSNLPNSCKCGPECDKCACGCHGNRPYFEIKAYTSGDAVLELVTPIKVIA